MKKHIMKLQLLLIVSTMTMLFWACTKDDAPALQEDSYDSKEPSVTQAVSGTLENTYNMDADETVNNANELFASIIDAYAELEQSGYTLVDNDILGDSLLAVQNEGTYNFGWDSLPSLVYAFYDINGDDMSELLIGVASEYGGDPSISGIYSIQDGKAESAIQVNDRCYLSLLIDNSGNCIINHAYAHMGNGEEHFYTIDETGKLVKLDTLYTTEFKINDDGDYSGPFYAKEVNGEEVSITEEEYFALLQKYGADGNGGIEEARKVIDWKYILEEDYGNDYFDDGDSYVDYDWVYEDTGFRRSDYFTGIGHTDLLRYSDKYYYTNVYFERYVVTQIYETKLYLVKDNSSSEYLIIDDRGSDGANAIIGDMITVYGTFYGNDTITWTNGSSEQVPYIGADMIVFNYITPDIDELSEALVECLNSSSTAYGHDNQYIWGSLSLICNSKYKVYQNNSLNDSVGLPTPFRVDGYSIYININKNNALISDKQSPDSGLLLITGTITSISVNRMDSSILTIEFEATSIEPY